MVQTLPVHSTRFFEHMGFRIRYVSECLVLALSTRHLICYSQILAFTGDNAASNDTQTTCLAAMENSFSTSNRVRCYNHILNLVAKALLRPFSNKVTVDCDNEDSQSETQSIPDLDDTGIDLDGEDDSTNSSVDDDDLDFIDYQWDQSQLDADQAEALGNVKSAIDKVCPVPGAHGMILT